MLKKGIVVDQAPPAKLLKKMDGKVWSIHVIEDDVAKMQKEYQVTNINRDEQSGQIYLRVLSELRPTETAQLVQPNLEDYYLFVFGNPQSS